MARLLTQFLCPRVDQNQPGHITINADQFVKSKLVIKVAWQEIPASWSAMTEDRLFYPGSHLSVAKMIVERIFKEELVTALSENEMKFRFLLPIWGQTLA